MKKAILTCGLFSMMMILTSFTQTTDIGGQNSPRTGGSQPAFSEIGGQNAPRTGGSGPSTPTGIKIVSESVQRSF